MVIIILRVNSPILTTPGVESSSQPGLKQYTYLSRTNPCGNPPFAPDITSRSLVEIAFWLLRRTRSNKLTISKKMYKDKKSQDLPVLFLSCELSVPQVEHLLNKIIRMYAVINEPQSP